MDPLHWPDLRFIGRKQRERTRDRSGTIAESMGAT